uniref:Uncharacterized protein n=2 Tax=Clytia hemisphaerica TaxID=252671 RepID=A0A7M5V311_9CNID
MRTGNYIQVQMKKLFIVCLLVIFIIGVTLNNYLNNIEMEHAIRTMIIQRYYQRFQMRHHSSSPVSESREKPGSMCKIPDVNPFGVERLKAWVLKEKQYCTVQKFGKIVDSCFEVDNNAGEIKNVEISYVIRGRKRTKDGKLDPPKVFTRHMDKQFDYYKVLNDDFHIHFSTNHILEYSEKLKKFKSNRLEGDFFQAKITKMSGIKVREYHATISNRSLVCQKHGRELNPKSDSGKLKSDNQEKSGLPYNIHMVMLDAISNANMYRQLPKFMEILEDDENAMIFKGHGIHGDGTTCQLMATLAGYMYRQEDSNPWQLPNNNSCDSIPLIFKDFNKAGYTTLYNEDFVDGSTFHYKMNGFDKPPVDWYPRPYWIAAHEWDEGCGKKPCICEDQQMMSILKTFTTVCEKEKKFSIQVTANAHDDLNMLFQIEDEIRDIYNFFKAKERINNTILILFSDHGARTGADNNFRNTKEGRLEEYNPFYSIILPPEFKHKYKDMYHNIKANTEVLTSHFDVHWTLKHIISYPNIEANRNYGQSLFTEINPKTRTCSQTGIPSKYCFCLSSKKLDTGLPEAKLVTNKAIQFINLKLDSHNQTRTLCSQLSLKTIISLEYAIDEQTKEGMYYVIFEVAPSSGTYDVRVRKDLKTGTLFVDPEISRTNRYGDQPACIKTTHPKLAPYCYCKSLLG